ncbi:hypothetical protein M8C21_022303 [Ambrosia artemisiifolia]|uniref:Lipoxygenase n=1 Tax=Ambrosia artemisiifolia TaxID=4212 RepID=A0AAD5G7P4_AMBAR|nr:hypothetical protein M8C21_022303 [Ambrosia artemisiifolia]
MLKAQINQSYPLHKLLPLHNKPFIRGGPTNYSSFSSYSPTTSTRKSNVTCVRSTSTAAGNIKAVAAPVVTTATTVKSVITIKPVILSALTANANNNNNVDAAAADGDSDLLALSILLEFVSNDLDANGNRKSVMVTATYKGLDIVNRVYKYEGNFDIPEDFGEIGAVYVENQLKRKMFFNTIALDNGVTFTCESWVQSKYDVKDKRIFFTDKSYLPSETPEALKSLRTEDLESLRGNGEGERKSYDRIYDYDVYNDLGDPDLDLSLARPVLGGKEYPLPRRCRTGRPMCTKDPLTESRTTDSFYVPCDEDFSQIKEIYFNARTLFALLHGVIPTLKAIFTDKDKGFPLFTSINKLYNEGVNIPPPDKDVEGALPRLIKKAIDAANAILKFETPETMDRDIFSWFRDEEFCRQMLAGLNPCSIQLVTEWPLMSKLDPKVYGPPESAITKEIVQEEIGGDMTFDEALAQKKLFMLDYHDLLLPYHVYTPTWDATDAWLWKLAKAHVVSHDSGYHQLVSHWLRAHGVTEPYIIATNRHLSQMHPIKRLLEPHFRYTMQINALARYSLINAGGIIESTFSPEITCMQLASDAYDQLWRFDNQALPADLISRGMAVEDQSAPHSLKLTIKDYPFANDGLLIYDAIKEWATSYVNYYYPQANLVESDEELQAWWNEIRTVGHADKKDEPWWPQLKSQDDLIGILSTIIWVASGHHSAVNFGQYDFAGYFPNRPSIARTKMPNEDPTDEEWQAFMKRPEDALLKCFPSQVQAVQVMAVLDVLSGHSPDEEYIGETIEPAWEAEPAIKAAFEEFQGKLNQLESIIDSRNNDPVLKNRNGAGLVPYELLKPYSDRGVTGRGVPNSISI